MACQFKKLSSDSDLGKLNEFLSTRSYIEGYRASQNDVCVYKQALTVANSLDCSKFPHVVRWFNHINAFTPSQRCRFPGEVKENKCDKETKCDKGKVCDKADKSCDKADKSCDKADKSCDKGNKSCDKADKSCDKADKSCEKGKGKKEEKAPAPAPAEEEEEEEAPMGFDDMGGEDSDDEAQKAIDAIAAVKLAKDAAAGKKAVIARSTLILDIKPEGSDTDMAKLEKDVRSITMEGLVWAGSEMVPVAYGVKKLRIISVIVDDLVSTDDLREQIETLDGCQSTDIYAFNKV